MAKKKENLIALETNKYEDKVKEFQDYLEQNSVVTKVTQDGNINEAENIQEKRHKELLIQMKIMTELPNWLAALKKLREDEENKTELRGGSEISAAARLMMDRTKE